MGQDMSVNLKQIKQLSQMGMTAEVKEREDIA